MRPPLLALLALLAVAAAATLTALGEGGEERSELAARAHGLADALEARADLLERLAGPDATLRTRFYEVADLTTPIAQSQLDPTDLRPSVREGSEEEILEPCASLLIDDLCELIRLTVDPQSWDTVEAADIRPHGTTLLVTQTPSRHERIGAFLAEIRRSLGRPLIVEIVAVAGEGRTPLGSVMLHCREALSCAQRSGRIRPYLADYDPEVAENARIGSPVGATLFEGCAAEVRVGRDPGAGGVVLQLRVEQTASPDPFRTVETEHGAVDLPVLQATKLATILWVPLGKTVVAGGATAGGSPCLFLVTVRES